MSNFINDLRDCGTDLAESAANEITRLRAENARLRGLVSEVVTGIEASGHEDGFSEDPNEMCNDLGKNQWLYRARAALSGSGE